jgi:hypothetical protein
MLLPSNLTRHPASELFSVDPRLFGKEFFLGLLMIRIFYTGIGRTDSSTLRFFVETNTFCTKIGIDDVKRIAFGYRVIGTL